VDEYNARSDKTDPSRGLLYLDYEYVREHWEPLVTMNRAAYRVRSPFADQSV
jgi:hypothetical protein